ncbi:DUF397 domain-containing protein [Streptomyces sp. ISL-11]|uniref:DUF397 domain-containing protein n=1 Tax=Streptomyces sp. ISL-11 TaxID=2819174 RepID=UPI001BE6A5C0|nr:DUF397 domain-containing protein [Streptomyces sp. ISL-11]MBT2382040.1 DUF397 domain-containing protein [Streptomyces sp. ISL-11]
MAETIWHKSSYSGADDNQDCLELASVDAAIMMRESDLPGIALRTSTRALRALIASAKADGLDRRTHHPSEVRDG